MISFSACGARFPYTRSAALITGASRGIGAALATALADRGIATLVLTARSEADLAVVSARLRDAHPDLHVETIAADLTDPAAPAAIIAETERRGVVVDLLVNNAGFGSHGPFDRTDAAKEEQMIDVNVTALVKLTRLFLPGMHERGRGGVLNIASTAALQPIPYMATYGATKAFVLSFSEALWAEAHDFGPDVDIRIVCACPGGTQTEFGAGMHRGRFENSPMSTADDVAAAALDALDRNASYAVVGAANYIGALGVRLAPRALVARAAASVARPLDSPAAAEETRRIHRLVIAAGSVTAAAVAAGLLVAQRRRRSGV
jgi:hypothetical protein